MYYIYIKTYIHMYIYTYVCIYIHMLASLSKKNPCSDSWLLHHTLVPDEKAAHRQVFGQAPPHTSQSREKMEKHETNTGKYGISLRIPVFGVNECFHDMVIQWYISDTFWSSIAMTSHHMSPWSQRKVYGLWLLLQETKSFLPSVPANLVHVQTSNIEQP